MVVGAAPRLQLNGETRNSSRKQAMALHVDARNRMQPAWTEISWLHHDPCEEQETGSS